jgi:hypothetical protein
MIYFDSLVIIVISILVIMGRRTIYGRYFPRGSERISTIHFYLTDLSLTLFSLLTIFTVSMFHEVSPEKIGYVQIIGAISIISLLIFLVSIIREVATLKRYGVRS